MGASRQLQRASQIDSIRQHSQAKTVAVTLVRVCIVLLTAFVALRFGRYTLARPMWISDDEGYLLLTFKHYFQGERLYTQVFTQYGPFYFLIQKAIFRMWHLPVTYDAGRQVFLGYWLLASFFPAIFVYRVSKNITLSSASALAVLWLERVAAHEPNHPEQMVLVLMMAGCAIAPRPNRISLCLLGVIGAELFWTKANVGIFFVAAALIASICVLPSGRLRGVGNKLLLGMAVIGPVVLMHDYFRMWAWRFCLLSVLATTATVIAGMHAQVHGTTRLRPVRFVVLGVVAGTVLVPIVSAIAGVPFRGLVDGVLVASLRQTTVFNLPIQLSGKQLLVAVALSIVVLQLYRLSKRPEFAVWVDVAKCVAGLSVIAFLVYRGDPAYGSAPFAMLYVLLPLLLLPRNNEPWEASEFFPRIFVAALAAMQFLQAYPVAGTQLNIGTSPFLLWAFVCIYDGVGDLREQLRSSKPWRVAAAGATVSLIGVFVTLAVIIAMFRTGRLQSAYSFPASSLPGSSSLHLPPEIEADLETVSNDVRANCGVLFTMPGMGGFNFWSGVATPNGFNEDNWMRGLPLSEQQETLQELVSNPSACAIVRPTMLGLWGAPDQGIETLPLAHYILDDMPVVFREGGQWGIEIRVNPGRRVPWVEQAQPPAGGLGSHAWSEEGQKQIPPSG